jgi:hypothetical protein
MSWYWALFCMYSMAGSVTGMENTWKKFLFYLEDKGLIQYCFVK